MDSNVYTVLAKLRWTPISTMQKLILTHNGWQDSLCSKANAKVRFQTMMMGPINQMAGTVENSLYF